MSTLSAIEVKAFVPSLDFALSKQFYQALGFDQKSEGGGIAFFQCGECAFLLQDFYLKPLADNFMMHLLVADVAAWWRHVQHADLGGVFGSCVTPIAAQPWGMTDFTVTDPSGVLWRIAQNTPGFKPQGLL